MLRQQDQDQDHQDQDHQDQNRQDQNHLDSGFLTVVEAIMYVGGRSLERSTVVGFVG